MKNLLKYRLASLKEGRFYFIAFLALALLFVFWIFVYFITRGVSSLDNPYSLRSTSPIEKAFFFSSCHNTLLATLPTLSFFLGTGLEYLFISSDYEKKRLKMVFGTYLGKRRFYLNAIFVSNLIGMLIIFSYWLLFAALSSPLWMINAVEGNVFFSVLITLLCSLVLFWFSLFLSGLFGIMSKNGVFAVIFCISLYLVAVFYTMISLTVTPPKDVSSFSFELSVIEKNPLAGLVLLNRYGNISTLWDHLTLGFITLPPLFLLGMYVYGKKEV